MKLQIWCQPSLPIIQFKMHFQHSKLSLQTENTFSPSQNGLKFSSKVDFETHLDKCHTA